jgi:hypothetical protein
MPPSPGTGWRARSRRQRAVSQGLQARGGGLGRGAPARRQPQAGIPGLTRRPWPAPRQSRGYCSRTLPLGGTAVLCDRLLGHRRVRLRRLCPGQEIPPGRRNRRRPGGVRGGAAATISEHARYRAQHRTIARRDPWRRRRASSDLLRLRAAVSRHRHDHARLRHLGPLFGVHFWHGISICGSHWCSMWPACCWPAACCT